MSQIQFDDDGQPTNTLAVIMIVGIVLILFCVLISFMYKLKENQNKSSRRKDRKNSGKHNKKHH